MKCRACDVRLMDTQPFWLWQDGGAAVRSLIMCALPRRTSLAQQPQHRGREQSGQLLERAALHSQNKDVFSRINGFTLSARARVSHRCSLAQAQRGEGGRAALGTQRGRILQAWAPPAPGPCHRPLWLWGKGANSSHVDSALRGSVRGSGFACCSLAVASSGKLWNLSELRCYPRPAAQGLLLGRGEE